MTTARSTDGSGPTMNAKPSTAGTHVPARQRVVENCEPVDASAGHHRHPLAPEELAVVEAAGVAKTGRGIEPHLTRYALAFGERGRGPVERHRKAAGSRFIVDT